VGGRSNVRGGENGAKFNLQEETVGSEKSSARPFEWQGGCFKRRKSVKKKKRPDLSHPLNNMVGNAGARGVSKKKKGQKGREKRGALGSREAKEQKATISLTLPSN